MSSFNSDLVNHDYEVNIGAYFGRGWEIFTSFAAPLIGFTVFVGLIGVVIGALPPPLGNGNGDSVGIAPILYNLFIAPILSAGYFMVTFQIARNRPRGFGDFFKGFNRYLPILLVSWVTGLLVVLGLVILILPGIYLATGYAFSLPLVVDKNLGFWSAMETSRRLITRRWFSFFVLGVVLVLVNIVGALALLVGLLVTIPLSQCIITAAYEDIVGLNSVAE